jgi:hypothetical protein
MRKTYDLTHPKIKRARLIEAAKHDIRKYIKRERRRELPKGVDFWDFDCAFGPTPEETKPAHIAELPGCIDEADAAELDTFYVEVHAKQGHRQKRPIAPPCKPNTD